jgi:CheY-like chemotaxis protein
MHSNKDTILFIDDEKICHTLLELIIPTQTRFKLISAYNGIQALELANKYQDNIALIISDIMLPDISGIEVCQTLYNSPAFSNIPVILQTGLVSKEEYINQLQGLNNLQVLHKPYKQEDLLLAIKQAIL